ncbi:MAG: S8 family serine peptidase [Bacteroidaceae bacterium]|nr:S8 family serine peptidase [Bacteroidaceae bacterium]
MKHKFSILTLSLLLGAMAMPAFSQVSNNNEDEVNKVDQRFGQDFVPGQVLVKMKDSSPANVRRVKGKFKSAGIGQLDAVLQEFGVEGMEQLLPHEKPGRALRKARAFNGNIIEERDLSQLYLLQMKEEKQVETQQLVERLAELPEVEFAEPNYKAYIMADVDDYAAEPLYNQQWGLPAINLPQLWGAEKISQKRPVIAILDTGIDITHPDLAANIWTNAAEAEGEEGYDNDNNGFKNDVHGWDFINQTGNIRDFNGHGTHCAGIAAAVGNNGVGITGANPDALIMPITIMQSDGTGDLATIIRGIDYAIAMGADVLSMSIGTYATSAAFEQALGMAYQNAILVAAAGNDGNCLNHAHRERGQLAPMPMFPAAYNFVLGVQASAASGAMAGFSNYDDDGSFFSAYGENELYNYELCAPGADILSTWPGGNYKRLNGTSMACPLAAGALSRLIQCKEIDSKEELFGDLIHSTMPTGDLDIYAAYQMSDANRKPSLEFVTYTIDDSEGDGDGIPDAGETISIYSTIRNGWGMASNIQLSIEVGELEDPNIVEFLDANVAFGSNLSSYAKNVTTNPLRLKINDDCVDGRHIKLVLKAACDNMEGVVQQEIVLIAENGVELNGILTEDRVLSAGTLYNINRKLVIPSGTTLTIEPGCELNFKTGGSLTCNGTLNAIGEVGKMITFRGDHLDIRTYDNGIASLEFVQMINSPNSYLFLGKNTTLTNCIIKGNTKTDGYICSHDPYSMCVKSNIYGNISSWGMIDRRYNAYKFTYEFDKCNVIGNFCTLKINTVSSVGLDISMYANCNIIGNSVPTGVVSYSNLGGGMTSDGTIVSANLNYIGTAKESIALPTIYDINNTILQPDGQPGWQVDLSNMPTQPISEAHGIVWKVVVNGFDAQDEFEQLPPLGVGRHKFEVYFNRPMNKEVAPQISFGVREPYTQQVVAEDGSWNEEGTIYTAYKTITGKTKSDGLNRIYVYGAEDDEFFEIPYENTRFNINIQAAGSMATGFMAETGLGKVSLTWNNDENNFDDAMGFNVYRYTEATIDNPTRINEDIVDIETTEFVDYDVTPGTTYYYMYKVLSTDLQEYDVSNVVAATPQTGELGDANGSGDVDVADVITTVNYAAGQQPKPFIFEAADMNTDLSIDILDVIGIIKKIMNPSAGTQAFEEATATYTIENGILYVESPVALAGVQVQLALDGRGNKEDVRVAEDLNGFEHTSAWLSDNDYLFLAYNMNGKTLPAGKHALLHIGNGLIAQMRLADNAGHNVEAIGDDATRINRMAGDVMTVPGIYDLQGRKITGNSQWQGQLPKGVYIINGKKVVR